MNTTAQVGDRVQVKLSDSDWQMATVVAREVTGFGTPRKSVSYYVTVGNLNTTVHASMVR